MRKCDRCEQEIPDGQPYIEVRYERYPALFEVDKLGAGILVGKISTYCTTCQTKVLKVEDPNE